MEYILYTFIALVIIYIIAEKINSNNQKADKAKLEKMSPTDREKYLEDKAQKQNQLVWGNLNLALVCPHCQNKGKVHIKAAIRKKGISGAKVTGALLTGGISLLATGLSRKEGLTQAHCTNCNSTWDF